MSAAWAWLRRNALLIYAGIAVLYMLLPIFVIALFSFDQTTFGRLDYTWSGFTLEYWQDAFSVTAVNDAMITSLQLAALATIVSTAIGTLIPSRCGLAASDAGARSPRTRPAATALAARRRMIRPKTA